MTRQLTLSEAAARGDRGMQQAIEHADRVESEWSASAFDALQTALRSDVFDHPFTFEVLRSFAEQWVSPPPDLRAWGGVAKRAISKRLIVATGNYAPRASGNCTPTMTYVRGRA
jgi:hypothetical protein